MANSLYGPLVINLDYRTDRLEQIDNEFKKLNMTYTRVSASTDNIPSLACIDSHCRCLEMFLQSSGQSAVFICEDDAEFKINRTQLDIYITNFMNSGADVLCLGYYSSNHIQWSELFYRSKDIQNRVSYIVKRHIAAELINIWRNLYVSLIYSPKQHSWYSKIYDRLPIKNKAKDIYRGDQAWKLLQQKYFFVIPKEHAVVQRPSYSNIEKRFVDYKT
jgi:hypothetical protein